MSRGRAVRVARVPAAAVVTMALGAVLVRLPQLGRPLSSDEGGFLMVAAQWQTPGRSLYGDYWVDRPPLLILLFRLADAGGPLVGDRASVRLLGAACVAIAVCLAGLLATAERGPAGRSAGSGRVLAAVGPAAVAAALLSSPLSGALEVDGELLAAPWVLAGLVCLLRVASATSRWWQCGLAVAAGAAGTAAVAIKQSAAEVLVAAAVWGAALLLRRERGRALRLLGGVGLGAVGTGSVLLLVAATHGTSPRGLWNAVVMFRARASSVIAAAAPATNDERALHLLLAVVLSGALLLPLAALLPGRRTAGGPVSSGGMGPLTTVTSAVLAWELVGVVGGGSYWLHYQVGLVPGLVLTSLVVLRHRPGRRAVLVVPLVVASVAALAAAAAGVLGLLGPAARQNDVGALDYLAEHARPSDTAIVAFGDPALLRESGLSSPYPQLWSLPVRVWDPRLSHFTRVLRGRRAPDWVVVAGSSLGTWGVDASAADPVLRERYRLVKVSGTWHLYGRRCPDASSWEARSRGHQCSANGPRSRSRNRPDSSMSVAASVRAQSP